MSKSKKSKLKAARHVVNGVEKASSIAVPKMPELSVPEDEGQEQAPVSARMPVPGNELASNASGKRILLALWIIAAVYVLAIDLKGISTDEGNRYILLAGGQTWHDYNVSGSFGTFAQVIAAVGHTQYLPLFYLIDNAVIRLGRSHSDVFLRLINVLWLMLSLQGLLRFFRKYGEQTRLFALAIFALNGFVLMSVMQVREYPLYLCLQIWSSCLLFEILETPGDTPWRRQWPVLTGYGGVAGLFFYTQPYSVLTLAAQVLMSVARRRNLLSSIRQMALAWGIAVAMIAPWMIYHFRTALHIDVWDTRKPTISLLFGGLKIGFRSLLVYDSWTGHPLMQLFVIVTVGGIVTASFLAIRSRVRPDARAVYALLTSIFFFIFQVAFLFLNQALSLWLRYFVAYDFGFVVLSTCAFAFFRTYAGRKEGWLGRSLSPAILVFVCVAGFQQVRLYWQNPFLDTSMSASCNWRSTAAAMLRYVRPDETVFDYNPLLSWTIGVSSPAFPNELSYNDARNRTYLAGKSAVWVLDTGVVPDYTQQTIDYLRSVNYAVTRTADLGCRCRLIRMEQAPVTKTSSTQSARNAP